MRGEDKLELVPTTLREARDFVTEFHRHNIAPQGHKFSIGLSYAGELIGVCIVGRPVSRHADDGKTAEILRVCVKDGYKNANSKLYGAAVRACKAMGYTKVLTYTLPTESGSSLRAVGFINDGLTQDMAGWDRPNRSRKPLEKYPVGVKIRWVHY